MRARRPERPSTAKVVDVVTVVSVLATIAVLVGMLLEAEPEGLRYPPVLGASADERPIAVEAGVFRLDPDAMAVAPAFVEDLGAHPRTLRMYQRLRAYPGAPPRIPHGLTQEEYRDTGCNACHERGGWAARFGAFAPVTPHADYGACLQCHVPRDELVGVARPASEAALVCDQCHVDPDVEPAVYRAIEWRATSWPELDRRALTESPHVIPHRLDGRSNCVACHAGPAAIDELRTDHPEWTNCRQCHVTREGEAQ